MPELDKVCSLLVLATEATASNTDAVMFCCMVARVVDSMSHMSRCFESKESVGGTAIFDFRGK